MSELSDLYQEIILDHNKRPRNSGTLADANRKAEGYNPLCGDELTVFLKVDGDRIADIRFSGEGCAISKASASLMTLRVKGKTVAEARAAVKEMHDLLTADAEPLIDLDALGDTAALTGVRKFPARVKCATLAWHALESALAGQQQVSTE